MTTTTKGTSARETILTLIEHDSRFPMRFIYDVADQLTDGYYVVQVDSRPPEIAELVGGNSWQRCGYDYDSWAYDKNVERIMVHARINLAVSVNELASASDTTSLDGPTGVQGIFDKNGVEVPLTSGPIEGPIPPGTYTLTQDEKGVPVYSVAGYKGKVLLTDEVHELMAEADSLAQEHALFAEFINWYSNYTGVTMDTVSHDYMVTSEEFKAYCAGFNIASSLARSQGVTLNTARNPSGT